MRPCKTVHVMCPNDHINPMMQVFSNIDNEIETQKGKLIHLRLIVIGSGKANIPLRQSVSRSLYPYTHTHTKYFVHVLLFQSYENLYVDTII